MAKIAAKDGVIKGILLHQGETDAYNEEWQKTVRKIYCDLQQTLQFDPAAVPLLVGEVVRAEYNGVCAHANPTINRLPEVLPNAYVVSSKGCEVSPDHVHFTADGYRTLGMRYGVKMLQAMGFEISDGYGETKGKVTPKAVEIDVDASVDAKGVVHATTTLPLEKIEMVSYSGQTLKTIPMNGETKADVDTGEFPDENHIVIVFYSPDGSSASVEVTR